MGSQTRTDDAGRETRRVAPHATQADHRAGDGELGPGENLGRYVILETVGRGGMGSVARAYDPKLRREVALKRLRSDALGDEPRQRLVREAQAMAQLTHPNVVAVYDVEASAEAVVLVMEFVPGVTLRTWLRRPQRTWREVVDKLMAAGRGLAAAHAAGLVHRDFKPANVLVSDEGSVKVTDFGLAKAATGQDTWRARADKDIGPLPGDASIDHEIGLDMDLTGEFHVVGTPRYMAPEQHRGELLGPAADQYAWCVTLWEGLLGEPPFRNDRLRNLALQKGAGPPAWPPRSDIPLAVADVVRRGLDPRPQDRWPSIEAALEAIDLALRPRRTRPLLLGAVLATALVGGGTTALLGARETRCLGADEHLADTWNIARREDLRAAFEATGLPIAGDTHLRVARRFDDYSAAWIRSHTDACTATSIRGEQSVDVMDLRMACLYRARFDLVATVDLMTRADAETVRRAISMAEQLPSVTACEDIDALTSGRRRPSDPKSMQALDEVSAAIARARSAHAAGRYREGLEQVAAARDRARDLDDASLDAEISLLHGDLLERTGDYEASATAITEALRTALEAEAWDLAARAAAAGALVVGERLSRGPEGVLLGELAVGISRGQDGSGLLEAHARSYLAVALSSSGDVTIAEAELRAALELREHALGPDHPLVATSLHNLAATHLASGSTEQAVTELERAIEIRERSLGARHPDVGSSRTNLGEALRRLDRLEEAEREHRRAGAILREGFGSEHPHAASSANNYANVLADLGRFDDAEIAYREAQTTWERALGSDHPKVAKAMINRAGVLHQAGRSATARLVLQDVLSRWAGAPTPGPAVPIARVMLAEILEQAGEHEPALRELALARAAVDPSDVLLLARVAAGSGEALAALGRDLEALSELELALALAPARAGDPAAVARTELTLARVLWALAGRSRSLALAESAVERLEAHRHLREQAHEARRWISARRSESAI